MGNKRRKTAESQGGQSLVEFVLVLPLLLVVLAGIFELGIAIWQYNTLSNVARETARYAIARSHQPLNEDDFEADESNPRSDEAAKAAGRRQAFGLDTATLSIAISPADWDQRSTWGVMVTATAAYTYSAITGLVPKGWVMLRSAAAMVVE